MKKYILILVLLLVSSFVISAEAQTQFELAEDSHWNYTRQIAPFGHWWFSLSFTDAGEGLYGEFTLTAGSDITFFICNEENYNKYDNGKSYSAYQHQADVTSGNFKQRLPSADTWYVVLDNKDSIFTTQTVEIDIYWDRTAPEIDINLDTGATYGGIKEITVTAADATFSVYKMELQYYRSSFGWTTVKTAWNVESISYNWDTKSWANGDVRWRVMVQDSVTNEGVLEVIVTVYNYVAPTTTTNPTTNPTPSTTTPTGTVSVPMPISTIFILAFLGLVMLIAFMKFKKPKKSPVHKEAESKGLTKIITEKVFVVCSYCGAKNEQGIFKCSSCGAEF